MFGKKKKIMKQNKFNFTQLFTRLSLKKKHKNMILHKTGVVLKIDPDLLLFILEAESCTKKSSCIYLFFSAIVKTNVS